MAIASPADARPSIAVSQNIGDETVQTQQNAEIDREATRTSPEVRQRSRGLVAGGLEAGALVRRVVLRISHLTRPPNCRVRAVSSSRIASRLHNEASHQKARPGIMTHRAMSQLQMVPQQTVINGEHYRLPHEHLRQGIFRCDQQEGPERSVFSALADSRPQPGRFRAGRSSAAYSPEVAVLVSGEPPRLLGESGVAR